MMFDRLVVKVIDYRWNTRISITHEGLMEAENDKTLEVNAPLNGPQTLKDE